MRQRPSARLLLVDGAGRLLLFRFDFRFGPLAGTVFWATPGGALDPGETYEAGAVRELAEETGLLIAHPGPQVGRRTAVFRAPEGDEVLADERYFLVRVEDLVISPDGWTALEREVMSAHRWWSREEIGAADEKIWPENLTQMLIEAGVWS